jgi:hypothetical protein
VAVEVVQLIKVLMEEMKILLHQLMELVVAEALEQLVLMVQVL